MDGEWHEEHALRVYLADSDRFRGRVLFEEVVTAAQELGLHGATVLRGVLGYGTSGKERRRGVLSASASMPVVVEVIDTREKLAPLIHRVEEMLAESASGGLVMVEALGVIHFLPRRRP